MKYLTRAEYLARFGELETVRLTASATTPNVIDEVALTAAIDGAEEFAEAYLSGRYDLPLPVPAPEVLREIVADLARERLHKSRPLQAVTDAADRARSLLKDLSAGRATLLVGDQVQEASASQTLSPVWGAAGGGSVFNGAKLGRF